MGPRRLNRASRHNRGRLVITWLRPWSTLGWYHIASAGGLAPADRSTALILGFGRRGGIEAAEALDCPLPPLRLHPPGASTTRTSRGPVVLVLALGKRSGERCNSFPMAWVRNVQETTGEVQEHTLAGRRHKTPASQ
jgi:hypothetical protein